MNSQKTSRWLYPNGVAPKWNIDETELEYVTINELENPENRFTIKKTELKSLSEFFNRMHQEFFGKDNDDTALQ